MKRCIFSFSLLITCALAFAQTEPLVTRGDFVTRGSVLVSYTGKDKDVKIPDNLGITEIGESVFGHGRIESVVVPSGITSIGKGAFASCYSLKNVTLPDTVKVIDDRAFYNCGLITVRIPTTVLVIGSAAFAECDKLARITMPADVLYIASDAIPHNFGAAYKNSSKRAGNYVYSRGFETWYTGNDPIPQAITVTSGTPIPGRGDVWFRVAIPDGGATLTAFTEGNTDTYIWLYDMTGNVLANDDDSGSGYNARTDGFVQTQTAYIKVRGNGAYSVNVRLE